MRILILTILCVPAALLHGASGLQGTDPVSGSFGGASISLPLGPRSVFYNPAWLCDNRGWGAAASFANLHDMPGLYRGQACFQVPVKAVTLASGAAFLGLDSIYREGAFRLGAAFQYGRAAAGLSGKVVYCGFPGQYGSHYTAASDIGAAVRIVRRIYCSGAVFNVLSGGLSGAEDPCPKIFAFGLGYMHGSRFRTCMEVEWEPDFPFTVRFGQEIRLFDVLFMRAGLSTEPMAVSFGVGFRLGEMGADLSVKTHPDLGSTKCGGVEYFRLSRVFN